VNTNSFFNPEEALEHGQSLIKKQVQVTTKTVTQQIAGQQTQSPGDPAQAQVAQDKSRNEFLDEMYAPSTNDAQQPQQPPQQRQSLGSAIISQIKGHSAEDNEKMAKIRSELINQHKTTYYEPLITKQEEERPAEKVEREVNEERWELQKKKQEEKPIALQMATNKAEQFRGAAG
jgi:hypothetical protein